MKIPRLFFPVIAATLVLSSAVAAPITDDTLRLALPAPELYIRHRAELALTDAQAAAVQSAIATMNREFRELTPPVEARTRELAAAVEDAATSAAEVQRRLDAVFEAENRLKASRLRASLAARRTVTPEQWKKLSELRGAAAPREPASAGAEPTREDLLKKLARVRELNREVFPNGPPADLRRLFNEAQNKVRAGRTAEAGRLFDRLIEAMEKHRATAPPANKDRP
jgi:Spy/CpxP family protein refolding chaperone